MILKCSTDDTAGRKRKISINEASLYSREAIFYFIYLFFG